MSRGRDAAYEAVCFRCQGREPMPRMSLPLAVAFHLAIFFAALLPARASAAEAGTQEPHSFTREIRKTVSLAYLLYLPKGYGQDPSRKWPVILFLHGSGERGSDLSKLKAYGPPRLVSEGRSMPFIIVSPQAPERSSWDLDALNALLDEVISKHAVDTDRIYLTGPSMGGSATWRLASAYPERFAAIAPICGTGDPSAAARLAQIPTWVFHGARDDLVPLQASQEMVDALRQAGNKARFTIYPDLGHDAWTATYNNPALFDWFLSHSRHAHGD